MRRDLLTSVIAIVVLTILLGLAYPLAMTGVAQVAFPNRANGSQVTVGGKVVGSKLIGQNFRRDPRYFQSRPSTATDYSASASAFTNLGPNSKIARDTFRKNLVAYLKLERAYDPGLTAAQVPIDAVTSSASGVDPQISVANARIQAHRIAKVRGLSLATVNQMIDKYTAGRFIDIFGEPAVNVLQLNLALVAVKS
jgi:potassium-transporting ATPase KdpC subunit